MRVRRIIAAVGILAVLLTLGLAARPQAAQAADLVQLNVTVHRIWEVNCDDNEFDLFGVPVNSCGNDYYARVYFPSGFKDSPRAADDQTEVSPGWTVSENVDRLAERVNVRLSLRDHDSTSGDDVVDIDGDDGFIDFAVDPRTGALSGQVFGELATPGVGFNRGSGLDSAAVWFSVTLGASTDFDRDGLHDGIEHSAIVTDAQGTIPEHGRLTALDANDVVGARPAVAASACRPTLLTEVDWMDGPDADGDGAPDHSHRPAQASIDQAVAGFSAGDTPYLGLCPYADPAGSGVELLLVADDGLPEVLKVSWNSGPTVAGVMITGASIRNGAFDAGLRPYFHYSLWMHQQPDTPPATAGAPPVANTSSGLCCSDSGKDVLVSLGLWNGGSPLPHQEAGTFIHEMGHALGLGHGGGDDRNCKPNYLSVMNYAYQTSGIPDASRPVTADVNRDGVLDDRDRVRLDLSRDALADLDEDALVEGAGIGAPTADLFVWDGDDDGRWNASAGNGPVNWNRSGTPPTDDPANIDADPVAADIDALDIKGEQGCDAPTPPTGAAGAEHKGYDDWANLEFKAPLSPPSTGVSVDSADELDEETADAIASAFTAAVSQTDLHPHLADSPDPVAAGTTLRYDVAAHNHGSLIPAYQAVVGLPVPLGLGPVTPGTGCTQTGGTVTCGYGDLAPGATVDRTVSAQVPADLVYRNGGPLTLTTTATASHDGPDTVPGNNSASVSTRVVAVADVSLSGAEATAPLELLIGETADLSLAVTATNGGPSSPIDTVLTTTTTSDAGVTVTPSSSTTAVDALAVGQPRELATTATVTCTGPGLKTIDLQAGLALLNAADTDPDLTDNEVEVSHQVDCVVPIAINVRPRSMPNPINLNTDATVAALTTEAGEYGLPLDFDATAIDVGTVLWGLRENLLGTTSPLGGSEQHDKGHPERSYELDERTRDADRDLLLHFRPADSLLTPDTTEACLKGRYAAPDGNEYTFFGCGSVEVITSP